MGWRRYFENLDTLLPRGCYLGNVENPLLMPRKPLQVANPQVDFCHLTPAAHLLYTGGTDLWELVAESSTPIEPFSGRRDVQVAFPTSAKGFFYIMIKECLVCKNTFTTKSNRQKYCGSKAEKTGCSQIMTLKTHSEWRIKNLDRMNAHFKKWRENNKEKILAHNMVNNSIKLGKLKREPCTECGDEKSEAHHPDYSLPLSVVWFYKKHHERVG